MISEQINLVKWIERGRRYDLAISSDSSIEIPHQGKLTAVTTLKPGDQNYLYEHQYFDWLMLQVRLLKSGRIDGADLKHIAEELEDMGNEAEAALTSFIRQTMVHLCKLEYSRSQDPVNHWRVEIANFRAEVDERIVNRFTNEDKLAEIYAKAWKRARPVLKESLSHDEFAKIPFQCPYSLSAIRDDMFFPISFWEKQSPKTPTSVHRPK